MLTEKRCSKCEETKPIDSFPKSGGKGGYSSWCRACHSARYARNKRELAEAAVEVSGALDPIGDLDAARREQGLTIREIAMKVGVAEANVSAWFNRKKAPRQKNLRELYQVLGLDLPMGLRPGDMGRIPLAVRKCANCESDFPVYKAGVRFCSKECSGRDLSARQAGAANARWKGGEYVTAAAGGGYIKEMAPGHPRGDASGYVMQHRLVMERVIGRYLESTERVHHKNGDRQDNRPENLELWVGVNRSKKDPHGVRLVDQVLDMIDSLTVAERAQVARKLADIEKLGKQSP